MEQYKVSTYRTAGELEKALNAMFTEGYKPAFITRGVEGSITVIYEKFKIEMNEFISRSFSSIEYH